MHLSTAVQWVAIVSVLIVGAGVIGAAFRSAGSSRALENYRSLAESYKLKNEEREEQVEHQRQEIEKLQGQMADKDRQMADLRGKIETLTEVIAGRAVFDDLTRQIGSIGSQQAAMAGMVGKIAAKVGA